MDQDGQTRRGAIGALMSSLAVPHVAPTALARKHATNFVATDHIFVAVDLAAATAAGEAAVGEGTFFKAVGTSDAIAEFRIRTADGSDLLYEEIAKAALQSTDPEKGAALVGYKAPYTDTVGCNIGGKFNDLVSVTDFDTVTSAATSAFTKAFAAANEYGRDLYIPKLDAGAKYKIKGDLLVPAGMKISGGGSASGTTRVNPGSVLEFEDGALLCQDAAGLTLENFQLRRIGTAGPALDFAATTAGTARNFLNNVSVIGSTGVGARFKGGWLFSWVNPYVRQCSIGILVEEGAFQTGMNSMSLFGGEIQANSVAGIVLDRCKQFNIVGTAIEGNGIGLGIGKSVVGANILAYFEANLGGHIMPYSHNGGSSGHAQCVVVQGGSYFYRGASNSTPSQDLSIDVPNCRQFLMEDGVLVQGYSTASEHIIHVQDVGDSNRATGYIGNITIDAPPEFVLDNDCLFFGRETRRPFYLNRVTHDGGADVYKVPLWKGSSTRRNPARVMTVIVHLDVTTGGDVVLTARARSSAGVLVGSQVNSTPTVAVGYNRAAITLADNEDIAYVEVLRTGASASDTAVGVTILSIELLTHENSVQSV